MKAINLLTEYLKSPIGIDVVSPTIYWNCDSGIKQTAFQIICKKDDEVIFDSKKIESNEMFYTLPLKFASKDRINYSIKLWDENDKVGDEAIDYFELGLLNKEDFKAKWISGNYIVKKSKRYPVDCFKKEFELKSINKARLYITACGLYECFINGKRVGEMIFAPGYTNYKIRIQYQTYDVTDLLNEGKNEIKVLLADGWYRGSCGAWGLKNQYGKQTKLYFQLETFDSSNNEFDVLSNEMCSWSNDGPIYFADNKDGEKVDANRQASYKGNAKISKYNVIPSASNNVITKEHEVLKGEYITCSNGKKLIDFKQNIAGYISFKVNAKKGDLIKIRCGELLDDNGNLTLKNIQCGKDEKATPKQEIIYTCKDGLNEYKTKFAIFGFQYVEIDSTIDIDVESISAIALYSDLKQTLEFNCSDDEINKLVLNTLWSAKNNHFDLPTDCPTRERHGWSGDAQIFCNTATYFFNYAPMARKYERDLVDDRTKNGKFRQIVPKGGTDFYMSVMDGSAGWSDAGVLIPYRIFKKYNDKKILIDNYQAMKKYTLYKIKTLGKHYLTSLPTGIEHKYRKWISNYGQSYGEWSEPSDVNAFKISDFVSPHPEETTAYIYYLLKHMVEIAKLLNKDDEVKLYSYYMEKVKIGYQHLVQSKKHSLDTNRQAKLVRPLYMDLLDEKQTEFAKNRLLKALEEYDFRLGTGFLATPFILYVLADINVEYAYKLLENKKCPGWLYMVEKGATTIWESWEGVDSRNHYSKGAVCEWIFDSMCGVNVDGVNHFLIKPTPGGSLLDASCSYQSIYGKVTSSWKKDSSNQYSYHIEVPPNTKATILLPNREKIEVDSGVYDY